MGVRRFLLRPVAFLAGQHAGRQLRAFLRAHERTEQVQDHLLRELLSRHADTAFGRQHGFASIRSYEEFVRAVPVRTYEALRPHFDRVLAGDFRALLPPGETPLMFSMTSGTTGEPKHIPVTRRFADQMRRGWNVFGLKALRDHREAWLRPILQISSPMEERRSPTGLPCGAVSGLLAAEQKRIVRWMYPVPHEVYALADPEARYYTILRCGVSREVALITTANPSTTIRLIEVGQEHAERLIRDVADGTLTPPGEAGGLEGRLRFRGNPRLARRMEDGLRRDGRLLPAHFWRPAALLNWTGGTLRLYLPRLRELFPGTAVRDIGLLASEGRFSVPLEDSTPGGVAEITGNFLEFLPAERRGDAKAECVRAHEVQAGGEYFLVVTNWAGLWRYDLDDRVRVTGFVGRSPVFEFLSRGTNTANITGEKLTEHHVVEAMHRACGAAVERFVVQGRFSPTPYYELRVEADGAGDLDALAKRVDAALCELNVEYASKRKSGRLGPVRPVGLPPGEMSRIEAARIRARRGRSEQYKHTYLLTDVLTDDGRA